MATGFDNIPDEIVENILVQLPEKERRVMKQTSKRMNGLYKDVVERLQLQINKPGYEKEAKDEIIRYSWTGQVIEREWCEDCKNIKEVYYANDGGYYGGRSWPQQTHEYKTLVKFDCVHQDVIEGSTAPKKFN